MIQQTIEKLKLLKLHGIVQALSEQMQSTQYQELSFEERISFLVEKEYLLRQNRKLERNLRNAKLRQHCLVEDIDFNTVRGLKRSVLMELAQCTWIERSHNLIITGPTGIGKTFLACALADKACRLLFRVRYLNDESIGAGTPHSKG